MEVRCPKCAKRLRYSDALRNPLLRCRSCGTTFRASEAQGSPQGFREPFQDESYAAVAVENQNESDERLRQFLDQEVKPAEPHSDRSLAKKGIGTFGIVVVILALKFGLRILNEVFRDRPQRRPRPVQLREQERDPLENLVRRGVGSDRDQQTYA